MDDRDSYRVVFRSWAPVGRLLWLLVMVALAVLPSGCAMPVQAAMPACAPAPCTPSAEALGWDGAARELLGGPGSALVLMARSEERGEITLAPIREMAQATNTYYKHNAYGQVVLDFTFLDADGHTGSRDWYTVDASHASDPYAWGMEVVRQALQGMELPEEVYLERVIIVYPGASRQSGASGGLYSEAFCRLNAQPLEVSGARHSSRVHLPHLILLAEKDELGAWVHEMGHTLPSSSPAHGAAGLADLYEVDGTGSQQSSVGLWDVMALGSYWGSPAGHSPVQMSSYTKVAAGWLHYREATPGADYTLTSVEGQQAGDGVWRLEDAQGYYIIEARDYQGPFGAPESGVLIFRVTYGAARQADRVDLLPPQTGEVTREQFGLHYQRPTLRGAASPQGVREFTDSATGLRVTLLAESFSPYRATVRIEDTTTTPEE